MLNSVQRATRAVHGVAAEPGLQNSLRCTIALNRLLTVLNTLASRHA